MSDAPSPQGNLARCPNCGWSADAFLGPDADALKPYRIDHQIASQVGKLQETIIAWKERVIQRHVPENTASLIKTPAGQRILAIFLKEAGYCFRYWPDGKIEFAKGDQILATFKHELKTI